MKLVLFEPLQKNKQKHQGKQKNKGITKKEKENKLAEFEQIIALLKFFI
ncbi:unnamed protein product [Paramecium primaurelia]|uniref:Uncharacterized protein n=1 Tax=Paramecium primaurelia TaxID=5886 RepID=A0A8S1KL94_PARPR|nr:unnamed protein product [Paramecium primaurelia]